MFIELDIQMNDLKLVMQQYFSQNKTQNYQLSKENFDINNKEFIMEL
tara:strand:+ start:226 stop:366 length:141 start_codon:yes stop_codon:yes gene_type:complete